jgi:CheY-like chemotaxis protein
MVLAGSKKPYIIAMTASAFEEDQRQCQQVGMHDFLSKPVRIDDLANSLHRAQQKIASCHLTLLSDAQHHRIKNR